MLLQYKNIPAQKRGGDWLDYLSQSFFPISGFLLQFAPCAQEQFLHLPGLFSDFDIFSSFLLFVLLCPDEKIIAPVGRGDNACVFPKKKYL